MAELDVKSLHADCSRAWPTLALPIDFFADWLRQREADATSAHEDLFLAAAIAHRIDGAVELFEQQYRSVIEVAIAKIDGRRPFIDEVAQRVRERVLVGGERPPAITSYSGRGNLKSWLRIVCRREAIRARQSADGLERGEDEVILELIAPTHDPELALLKRDAAEELRAALLAAIADLEKRERAVLRMSVLDGLTIDQIAPMYAAHRATVARWIGRAKKQILDNTREILKRNLGMNSAELDSLIAFARSQLELSLGGALDSSTTSHS